MVFFVTQKLGNRRVTGAEQFYTPRALAEELTGLALGYIADWQNRSFLEPAAGTGSFLQALTKHGVKSITAIDKDPKHPDVSQNDYLDFVPPQSGLVTLSNPPFGRNNALSIPFFNHAAGHSDYIAFLVPRSWRKWSVQNRLDANFHLILDRDVFVSYENEFGEPLSSRNELRTCFQIWERRDYQRELIAVPNNQLVKKSSPQNADLALRVFGFGCGSVLRDFERRPNTTLMFLEVGDPRVFDHIDALDYQRFTRNTAYTEALAFSELNYLLNEAIFGAGMHRIEIGQS